MYEKLEECPACKHSQFNNFIICKDYYVSNESFALVKCSKCQLVFTNPRPIEARISEYRPNIHSPLKEAMSSGGMVNTIVRRITGRFKREAIYSHKTSGHLLDYGLYDAKFLETMSKSDWKVDGLTTYPEAGKSLPKTINLLAGIHSLSSQSQYDVITSWHTLDQSYDLKSTFKALRKSLKPDGYMFVALTNHNSLDAKSYREAWAAYDQPRALYHFSIDSFTRFVKQNRMNVLDVLPMKFYSYYVSVLSENIINSKNSYVNALTSGLKSNKSAKMNSEQYSSLIYVLTK